MKWILDVLLFNREEGWRDRISMRNGTAEGLNANGGVSDRCVTVELLTGEHFLVSIEVSKHEDY